MEDRRKKPVEFVILTASYNNEYWCAKNLGSIAEQSYPHWQLYYIDDASTDATYEFVELFTKADAFTGKTTIVRNSEHKGSLANFYTAIHQIEPHKVIVCLDGDDYFATKNALEIVAIAYEDPTCWMTYGSFDTDPPLPGICLKPHSEEVCQKRLFRSDTFSATHLKTFYAKLFQRIKKEDLTLQGQFFPVAGDMAFMYAMLEMASEGHIRFIKDCLYIYNVINPLNDRKLYLDLCVVVEKYIRAQPPYKPLKKLF